MFSYWEKAKLIMSEMDNELTQYNDKIINNDNDNNNDNNNNSNNNNNNNS